MTEKPKHAAWSSRLTYVLFTLGGAVGLGNMWKFPYTAGANGAGVFILTYLVAVVVLGIPMLMAESALGRHGQKPPPGTLADLAEAKGYSRRWGWIGFSAMASSLIALGFYSVIAGFSIAYIAPAFMGHFFGASAADVEGTFTALRSNPYQSLIWHSLFALITWWLVARGIKRGLEWVARLMMPSLFGLLLFLVAYAYVVGDFGAAWDYLFTFNLNALTPAIALAAVGQAFFSLNVGAGGTLTFTSYNPHPLPLAKTSAIIAAGDTLVAILAGLAIFPIVFANGLNPSEGPGLVFMTLPLAFGAMPFGNIVGGLFFMLFMMAAITSSVGMLEISTSYFEGKGRWTRRKIALALTGFYWVLGFGTIMSLGEWQEVYPLSFLPVFEAANIFEISDYVVSNLLLPLTAAIFALLAGWALSRDTLLLELGLKDGLMFKTWLWIARVIAPAAILYLFWANLNH